MSTLKTFELKELAQRLLVPGTRGVILECCYEKWEKPLKLIYLR